mgnify:CR=1 FL=1
MSKFEVGDKVCKQFEMSDNVMKWFSGNVRRVKLVKLCEYPAPKYKLTMLRIKWDGFAKQDVITKDFGTVKKMVKCTICEKDKVEESCCNHCAQRRLERVRSCIVWNSKLCGSHTELARVVASFL